MPVYEERANVHSSSSTTMLLTFLLGMLIIIIALVLFLHGVMHLF